MKKVVILSEKEKSYYESEEWSFGNQSDVGVWICAGAGNSIVLEIFLTLKKLCQLELYLTVLLCQQAC